MNARVPKILNICCCLIWECFALQEAGLRAEENERRRKRLDEMRQIMEGSGTPNRPPPKPPRSYLYHDPSGADAAESQASPDADQVAGESSDDSTEENNECDNSDCVTPIAQSPEDEEKMLVDSTIDRNLTASQDYDKVQHKVIPQLILTGDPGEGSSRDPEPVLFMEQEPDIIQSTKASSLERKLPPPRPVAPPRRKKRKAPLPPGQEVQ